MKIFKWVYDYIQAFMYTVDLSCYKIIHPGKTENMKSSNYDDIYAHYECLETSDQNCITKAQLKKKSSLSRLEKWASIDFERRKATR